MSSQAPRADERLPLVSQRREQHQQLGGGELSRLSTSMAIGAVVVEVQTEEELAVQAACGWEIREVIRSAEKKTNRKNEESSPVEGRAGAHFSFSFFSNSPSVPRTNLPKLAPPDGTTGRHGKKSDLHSGHFRAFPPPPINYPTHIRCFGAILAKNLAEQANPIASLGVCYQVVTRTGPGSSWL